MNILPKNDGLSSGLPAAPPPAKTGESNPAWETKVYFPEWQAVLGIEPLDEMTRGQYAMAIIV